MLISVTALKTEVSPYFIDDKTEAQEIEVFDQELSALV